MSPLGALALAALVLALLPAALVAANLRLYRPLPAAAGGARPRRGAASGRPRVSVLIPARDEEATIGRAVRAALAGSGEGVEVVVMDDASRDRTAEIVAGLAAGDPRVRLATAPPLPPGWNGKQHACAALAAEARGEVLLFVDADVELAPGAAARAAGLLGPGGPDLASGVPGQETGSFAERLLLPWIHFVLLGYLPISLMRRSPRPSLAAGCGQLVAVRREAYRRAGGHAAIRASRHDGLTLPRAFRRAGFATDLFDATDVARCRMYRGGREVWWGLAKNAVEGMAAPGQIALWTVLLGLGHAAPPLLLAAALFAGAAPWAVAAAGLATVVGPATRLALARRFRQPRDSALLHAAGAAALLVIQWHALARHLAGRPVAWKGRGEAGARAAVGDG